MDMLSMEETFIVTGLFILAVGIVGGLLMYWLFGHDNEQDDNE